MSIKPIDIMKSQEASQYKHIDSQKLQHEQIQIGKSFQNTIRQEMTKTTEASKSDNTEYRYDAKEKGNNRYYGSDGRKKKQQQEENKDQKEPKKTGGIDILI